MVPGVHPRNSVCESGVRKSTGCPFTKQGRKLENPRGTPYRNIRDGNLSTGWLRRWNGVVPDLTPKHVQLEVMGVVIWISRYLNHSIYLLNLIFKLAMSGSIFFVWCFLSSWVNKKRYMLSVYFIRRNTFRYPVKQSCASVTVSKIVQIKS